MVNVRALIFILIFLIFISIYACAQPFFLVPYAGEESPVAKKNSTLKELNVTEAFAGKFEKMKEFLRKNE